MRSGIWVEKGYRYKRFLAYLFRPWRLSINIAIPEIDADGPIIKIASMDLSWYEAMEWFKEVSKAINDILEWRERYLLEDLEKCKRSKDETGAMVAEIKLRNVQRLKELVNEIISFELDI